jgi:hypothetical protein
MPPLAETRPAMIKLARRLRHTRSGRQRSLHQVSAELAKRGFVAERTGRRYEAAQIFADAGGEVTGLKARIASWRPSARPTRRS